MNNIDNALNNFLDNTPKKTFTKQTEQGAQVCDITTGKCDTIESKDGLIERVDKTYITKDGKVLLKD
jgi:hypothetical protein